MLQENKLSDFSEISLAALKSFGNELEPTELGKYLDDKIEHILVDEYQDTSFKQEELLKKTNRRVGTRIGPHLIYSWGSKTINLQIS